MTKKFSSKKKTKLTVAQMANVHVLDAFQNTQKSIGRNHKHAINDFKSPLDSPTPKSNNSPGTLRK